MAFFEQLKDAAKVAAERTETFAKNVGERAEAALEVQKLSSAITKKQAVINDEYRKIGEYMYKSFAEAGSVPDDLLENCAAITAALAEIDVLTKKIAIIKTDKLTVNLPKITCPECGREVLATAKFCPECGAPINENSNLASIEAEIAEERQAKAQKESAEEVVEADIVENEPVDKEAAPEEETK